MDNLTISDLQYLMSRIDNIYVNMQFAFFLCYILIWVCSTVIIMLIIWIQKVDKK